MYNYCSTILLLLPAFNLKVQEPWDFYLDGCSKLSNSYGIIIGGDQIRHDHEKLLKIPKDQS